MGTENRQNRDMDVERGNRAEVQGQENLVDKSENSVFCRATGFPPACCFQGHPSLKSKKASSFCSPIPIEMAVKPMEGKKRRILGSASLFGSWAYGLNYSIGLFQSSIESFMLIVPFKTLDSLICSRNYMYRNI